MSAKDTNWTLNSVDDAGMTQDHRVLKPRKQRRPAQAGQERYIFIESVPKPEIPTKSKFLRFAVLYFLVSAGISAFAGPPAESVQMMGSPVAGSITEPDSDGASGMALAGKISAGTTNLIDSDSSDSLSAACSAAAAAKAPLMISKSWTLAANLVCGARMSFRLGTSGVINLNGHRLTTQVPFAEDTQVIYNAVSGGSVTYMGPVSRLSVIWFGAKGDGKTDDTVAVQSALETLIGHGGARLYFPSGSYKVGANGVGLVNAPYLSYILEGDGTYNTSIKGSGSVVLDLCGSDKVTIEHLAITGVSAAIGLQLCRYATPGTNGPGSAHVFNDVLVNGTFTTAAVYSVASENNTWNRSELRSTSGVPLLYTSGTNDLGVTPYRGTILASTNTETKILNSFFEAEGGAGSEAITFGGSGGSGSPGTSVIHSYFACTYNCVRFTGAAATYNLGPYNVEGNFFEAAGSHFTAIQVDPVRLSELNLRGNYVSNMRGSNPDFYESGPGGDIEGSKIENNAWTSRYPNLFSISNTDLDESEQYTIRSYIQGSRVRLPVLSGSPSITNSEVLIKGALGVPSFSVNSGTAVTGNQGNGALVQHSTGTPTSGNPVSFDAHGNTVNATGAQVNALLRGIGGQVFSSSTPNETSAVARYSFYTPSANGEYQIVVSACVTAVGTAGTFYVAAYMSSSATSQQGNVANLTILGACSTATLTGRTSSPLQIATQVTGAAGSPAYTLDVTAIYMQP